MKYLDLTGLQTLWTKIKTFVQTTLDGYAKKTDIPNTSNFVTKDENGGVFIRTKQGKNTIEVCETEDESYTVIQSNALQLHGVSSLQTYDGKSGNDGQVLTKKNGFVAWEDAPSGSAEIGDIISDIKAIRFDNQTGDIKSSEDGLEVFSQYDLLLKGGYTELIGDGVSIHSQDSSINLLEDGDIAIGSDNNIGIQSNSDLTLYGNDSVGITSDGDVSLNSKNNVDVYSKNFGVYVDATFEVVTGENDDTCIYGTPDYLLLKSPQTRIQGLRDIETINEGYGQAGQVLTTDGSTVYWGNPSGGTGDSSIIDLGEQGDHKTAQQAMVDQLLEAETGCYLFKYYCSCYNNSCFAVVMKNDVEIAGTVYDSFRSFREFDYTIIDETYALDGCWLRISCFDEEDVTLTTENKTVIDAINELNSKIGSGGGGSSSPMTYITYAELKALRDDASLEDGMFYRITDYQCTTSQAGTRATDHRFDIIVQALSCSTLSEIAKADFNSEDSYFADNNANLSAWELKYCLDNDTTRFAWAMGQAITNLESACSNGQPLVRQPDFDGQGYDEYQYAWGTQADVDDGDPTDFVYSATETLHNGDIVVNASANDWENSVEIIEGKGVIYYMKDEHGNECPYDFKNIQFKRNISLGNGYPEFDRQSQEEGSDRNLTWVYTFCGNSYHIDNDEWSELKDGSLESPYGHESDENTSTFHHNVMGEYRLLYDGENEDYTLCGKQYLNNNVFLGYWEEIDSTSPDNCPYYYAYCCAFNTLDYNCHRNTFSYGSNNNDVGAGSYNNYISSGFNKIGSECYGNNLLISFSTLGHHCINNTLEGGDFTLGNGCWGNYIEGHNIILLDNVYSIRPDGRVENTIYKGNFTIV